MLSLHHDTEQIKRHPKGQGIEPEGFCNNDGRNTAVYKWRMQECSGSVHTAVTIIRRQIGRINHGLTRPAHNRNDINLSPLRSPNHDRYN